MDTAATVRTFGTDEGAREFAFEEEDFDALRALVHHVTGIRLPRNKRNLLYRRLSRRLRALGLSSFAQYRQRLSADPQGTEMVAFVNALTTHLTSFFREPHHFEHLREQGLAPLGSARPGQRFRLWSAGCSTGEEPYSIAMLVCEVLGEAPRADVKILATDVDSDVLNHARHGVYGADQIKGVDAARLARFFDTRQEMHAVKPAVARLITFEQLNLMHELPLRGPLDVIFCRNVVSYFDPDTQRRLLRRYARLQRPGDLLFIGHSERLREVSDHYGLVGTSIYQRNGVAA